MGRIPEEKAGKIYRNCDQIAVHRNEIRRHESEISRLRHENETLEHAIYQEKTGKVVSLDAYRSAIRFPRITQRPSKRKPRIREAA